MTVLVTGNAGHLGEALEHRVVAADDRGRVDSHPSDLARAIGVKGYQAPGRRAVNP